MRNTSHTADLEVGSVEAIVDEHGRVEGLGRLIPGPRHDVFRTGLPDHVICRSHVPGRTQHHGGRRPQAMAGRARPEGLFNGPG